MTKLISVFCLVFSISSFADFPELDFQNLSIIVDGSDGNISGDFARYAAGPVWIKHADFNFNFHQKPNKLIIEDGTTAVSLQHQLPFLNSFQKFHLHNVKLSSTGGLFTTDFNRLEIITERSFFDVSETNASCNGKATMSDIGAFDSVINSCLNRGVLGITKLDFKNDKLTHFFSDVQQMSGSKNPFKINQVKDIKLELTENKLYAEATIKPVVKITIKVNGSVAYNDKKNEVAIKVEKAKWGFLSIKALLFKLLEKIKMEEVRVEKPYLYVDLSNNNEKLAQTGLSKK